MKIKYSLNQTLVKYFFCLLVLCFSAEAMGQISGGEVKPDKEKKENGDKKDRKKKDQSAFNSDSLSGSEFYLTGLGMWSYRDFEDNSVYGVHERALDEVPMYTGGGSVGVIMPLAGRLALDAGLTFFAHGEAYSYEHPTNDSTFNYSNVYMQVGIPLRLRYTWGNDFQVFGYGGVTPVNILNIRYKSNYTDSLGVSVDSGLRNIKNGFTTFNLMASGGLGMNYYFNSFGITASAEYRRHLMNTYSEDTFKRDHKMFGVGLNIGITLRL